MSVIKTTLPFAFTRAFTLLFLDYVQENEKLEKFYSYHPGVSSFKKALADISSFHFNRSLLTDVIKEQYATGACTVPASLLSDLRRSNSFTICTGHQLCLFTGPLYFIYKLVSAINLAETLKKAYPEFNFIPVYWMASEDHDVEEINHVHIFGKKIVWKTRQEGAAGAFETASMAPLMDEVKKICGETENAKLLSALFEKAYLKSSNLADATRILVNELFGKYGLVVVDGNDRRLKASFASVMSDDIFNQANFKIVNETAAALREAGYDVQVTPRPVNIFYLEKNARRRIEYADEKYREEISAHPERFSPNVVLRPLYQQKILPNIAYVGGPGEISYWLEYKNMFREHAVFFPTLVPRSSVLWLDEQVMEQVKKTGISVQDLFMETEALLNKTASKEVSEKISLGSEQEELKKIFTSIASRTAAVDATLKASAEAELQRVLKGIQNLEMKMLRVEKQKQETLLNRVRRLKEKLFPEGKLQERYDNFIPYYNKYGEGFIDALKTSLDPMELKFNILMEELHPDDTATKK